MEFCGVDIIEVDRVKQAILNTSGFKEKVFTPREIQIGETKSELVKYQYYAGRFAAKEAVYKALSKMYGDKLCIANIEILNDAYCNNRPYINIMQEEIKSLQDNGKLILDVSISHIKDYATSSAIARFLE